MSTAQSTPTSPTAQRVKSAPRVVSSPLRPTSPQSSSTLIPSNSRRSSLGVGQTPRTKTPPGPLAKSRARDLLRRHYGLGVGPPPPIPGKSDDPMDLDSAAFDAKSYYEQLITASSLSALLKRENDLLTGSDTIAAMKTRAEGLDADLDLLKAAFSEISRLGAKVSIEEQPQHADGNSDS
ncbi:uncharacterized protein HD556DRAFT_1353463 [Suillus plorans]|uniref:Vacuolar protein sorting-associated protein 51 homolog n=1 Tax=Suillus plorans TaxID=116603 RepID=A0A9P7DLY4_9AGAM|nr:uncharacterized protein HD556DRAFT_1353463 [Suillus plorans]KAG1798158.1 hypothetical protein HD556DRAFT_1353463 [Suillus plorans]